MVSMVASNKTVLKSWHQEGRRWRQKQTFQIVTSKSPPKTRAASEAVPDFISSEP